MNEVSSDLFVLGALANKQSVKMTLSTCFRLLGISVERVPQKYLVAGNNTECKSVISCKSK